MTDRRRAVTFRALMPDCVSPHATSIREFTLVGCSSRQQLSGGSGRWNARL